MSIGFLITSKLLTLTKPLVGIVIPVIIDINVVFPAPLGPNKAKISPLFISREIFSSALNPLLYVLYNELIDIIGFIKIPN